MFSHVFRAVILTVVLIGWSLVLQPYMLEWPLRQECAREDGHVRTTDGSTGA